MAIDTNARPSPTDKQYAPNTVPTNTDALVDYRAPEKLEQNTMLGKFAGHTSEAK